MKSNFIFSLFLLFSISLFAQKVDLDKYRVTYGGAYVLPKNPLPEDYRTYNVTYSGNSNTLYYPTSMLQEVVIGGWRKVDATKGHITVVFETGALIIDKSEIAEREEIQKDKNGKETGRKKYYKLNYNYSMPAYFYVTDFSGKNIYKEVNYNSKRTGSYSSSEFNSYNAAYDYKNNNHRSLLEQFGRELIQQAVSSASASLTNQWGFRRYTNGGDFFWLMDSKKHPEQDSMQIMAKFIKETVPKFMPEMPVSEFKELIKPFTQYCLNLPNKYKTDEKADKKLRYAAYYNLAKLGDYMDDPDAIEMWGKKIIENDFDKGDGEAYVKDAKDLREIFNKAKVNTRHLQFDVNSFLPPN